MVDNNPAPQSWETRSETLKRLRWNLFGPVEDVLVLDVDGPEEKDVVWRPFLTHPLRKEPVMKDPRCGVTVYCRILAFSWADMNLDPSEDPNEYLPDPLVLVPWENGDPITVEEFVREVHEYFMDEEVKPMIDECYNGIPPTEPAWYDGLMASRPENYIEIHIIRDSELRKTHWSDLELSMRARLHPDVLQLLPRRAGQTWEEYREGFLALGNKAQPGPEADNQGQ